MVPVVPKSELPLLEIEDEEPASDVAFVRAAPAPGRSWATTTPMATVAPVATTMAPLVSMRSRTLALSRSSGVLGWPKTVMWWSSSVGDAPYPNMLKSTPTQDRLWFCCDILPQVPRR